MGLERLLIEKKSKNIKRKIKKCWKIIGIGGLTFLLTSSLSNKLNNLRKSKIQNIKVEYHTPNIRPLWREIDTTPYGSRVIRIGDLNNDGKPEILFAQCEKFEDPLYGRKKPITCLTAINLEGKVLWQIGKPNPEMVDAEGDLPVQIDDINGDGNLEVICIREGGIKRIKKYPTLKINRKPYMEYYGGKLQILDGKTGKIKKQVPILNIRARDSLLTCELDGNPKTREIIIKDRHSNLYAYDSNLRRLWSFNAESIEIRKYSSDINEKDKDINMVGNIAHFPLIIRRKDGKDNIFWGYGMIDFFGRPLFSIINKDKVKKINPYTLIIGTKGHTDGIDYGDIDYNPTNGREIVFTPVLIEKENKKYKENHYVMMIGENGRVRWKKKIFDGQDVIVGDFRQDIPGSEIAVVEILKHYHRIRTNQGYISGYGSPEGQARIILLDKEGKILWKREEKGRKWEWQARIRKYCGEKGKDEIIVYRRGYGNPPVVLDGRGKIVEEFELSERMRELNQEEQIWALPLDVKKGEKSPLILYIASKNGGVINIYTEKPIRTKLMRNITHYCGPNSN